MFSNPTAPAVNPSSGAIYSQGVMPQRFACIAILWSAAALLVSGAEVSLDVDPFLEARVSVNSSVLPFQNTSIHIPLDLTLQSLRDASLQKRGVSWVRCLINRDFAKFSFCIRMMSARLKGTGFRK